MLLSRVKVVSHLELDAGNSVDVKSGDAGDFAQRKLCFAEQDTGVLFCGEAARLSTLVLSPWGMQTAGGVVLVETAMIGGLERGVALGLGLLQVKIHQVKGCGKAPLGNGDGFAAAGLRAFVARGGVTDSSSVFEAHALFFREAFGGSERVVALPLIGALRGNL